MNDVKTGALVGVDKYGNKYYEDTKHYFFGECTWFITCLFKLMQSHLNNLMGYAPAANLLGRVFRTTPLGDLHHGDEWEEDAVGGGRQHGASWMVRQWRCITNTCHLQHPRFSFGCRYKLSVVISRLVTFSRFSITILLLLFCLSWTI